MHCSQNSALLDRQTQGISLYLPFDCEILAVSDLTPNEKLFRLQLPEGAHLGHLPGQFVQVSLLGWGESPISIASSPTRVGWFELGVRRVGSLTTAMHQLKAGDKIGIRGPYGRPFDLKRLQGKDLLLISGGCGLAPMRSLIQYCDDRREEFGRINILYGAKSIEDSLFKEDLTLWEGTSHTGSCVRQAGIIHWGRRRFDPVAASIINLQPILSGGEKSVVLTADVATRSARPE